ncbi:Uncharacterised protein [Mycobacteroides abscessus subsp. abscessus]|nr:Uncharacterised protein [Mycobacteroides abscessus subsp. abscessus]
MAAARPISMPRRHFGFSVRQSAATSAISSRLTWPKSSVERVGSSSIANGRAQAVANRAVRRSVSPGHTRRATRYSVSASAAVEVTKKENAAMSQGSSANGASTRAANGG